MDTACTRRDLLAKGVPAAAMIGAGWAGLNAYAQQPHGHDHDHGHGGGHMQGAGGAVKKMLDMAYGNGQYRLPPLPYDYQALEPHIDEQTMRLHHDKHHQGYVDGLNQAVKEMRGMGSGGMDGGRIYATQRNLSFNGSGHLLHTLFWATMGPGGGASPEGMLGDAINKTWGSFDGFKAYFSKAAGGVKGSGWGLLAFDPVGGNLIVLAINEHDTELMAGAIPLLPIDVWEHAYYLKYQNKRSDYIKAWWNVVNWKAVDEAYSWYAKGHQGV